MGESLQSAGVVQEIPDGGSPGALASVVPPVR
jgi:hypothetical protein